MFYWGACCHSRVRPFMIASIYLLVCVWALFALSLPPSPPFSAPVNKTAEWQNQNYTSNVRKYAFCSDWIYQGWEMGFAKDRDEPKFYIFKFSCTRCDLFVNWIPFFTLSICVCVGKRTRFWDNVWPLNGWEKAYIYCVLYSIVEQHISVSLDARQTDVCHISITVY